MTERSVLTIGNFDGIHLGHQKLLKRMTEAAKAEGLLSVVLSYTDHPAFTLQSHAQPRVLCPSPLKQRQLHALGIDEVELLSFNNEFARISAAQFLQEYILPVWNPRLIVMGYDSHFGYQRSGNYQFLLQHADEYGFRVEYVEPLVHEGKPISSSMIRDLLVNAGLEEANLLLGKPYRLLGKVGYGIGKGLSFGFPTANLILSYPHQLIPAQGIYLSKVYLDDAAFFGLTNIGSSPTVKHSGEVEIETFILDYSGDLYNRYMEVELIRYLREEKMFNSEEELVAAIKMDVSTAKSIISGAEL
jgi:riboflavin kinase/FMN adenylyltransferase